MAHIYQDKPDLFNIQRKQLLIAGITIFAHFSGSESSPFTHELADGYKILYLLHGRAQNAEQCGRLASVLLNNYYSGGNGVEPLIILTFDLRNHGARTIDAGRNNDWSEGNETHAIDMLSVIDATVEELKNIVEYLPIYYPLLGNSKLTNIVSGISMGGHITIRIATKYPDLFDAAIPIVGSFDMTSLVLNRLHDLNRVGLFLSDYSEIKDDIDTVKYPQPLFDRVSSDDEQVLRRYNTTRLRTFALFGAYDKTVDLKYSTMFLKEFNQVGKPRTELVFDQKFQAITYDAKHQVTDEMIEDISNWLVQYK